MSTDNVRRVAVVDGSYVGEVINDDPGGDYMLVPIKVWPKLRETTLGKIMDTIIAETGNGPLASYVAHFLNREFAEIGGEDE